MKPGGHLPGHQGLVVAPRAGAWVETRTGCWCLTSAGSHPVRVRGLKLGYDIAVDGIIGRTPCGCVG